MENKTFFIYRNSTIEPFFSNYKITYSDYDSFTPVNKDFSFIIWWYTLPVEPDQNKLKLLLLDYKERLSQVLLANIPFLLFTIPITAANEWEYGDFSIKEAIFNYNKFLYELAENNSFIKVIDIQSFFKNLPVKEWIDWKYYFISQMNINPRLVQQFKAWFNNQLQAVAQIRKKVLVLDFDNTLWGGILGEDGPFGIQVSEGSYPGNVFYLFQRYILEVAKQGVLLAACSKNNLEDVEELWEKNDNVLIKKNHFASLRINWQEKAQNIFEIAKELNLGLDSFVFLDDNPIERELVKAALPEVTVPDFSKQPYDLIEFIQSIIHIYFPIYKLTAEDKNKLDQYKENAERIQYEKKFNDKNTYLKNLGIKIKISKADNSNIQRISQLTQKTNQFNLTTKRYSESDIQLFIKQGYLVTCAHVKDKFGDNGITGVSIVKIDEVSRIAEIDSYLLSCRILGRDIETSYMNTLLCYLQELDIQTVNGYYIASKKNLQVSCFYDNLGFKIIEEKSNEKCYRYELNQNKINFKNYHEIEVIL